MGLFLDHSSEIFDTRIRVIVFLCMVYHTFLPFRTDGAWQVLDDGDDRGGIIQVPEPRKEVELTIHVRTHVRERLQPVTVSFSEFGRFLKSFYENVNVGDGGGVSEASL